MPAKVHSIVGYMLARNRLIGSVGRLIFDKWVTRKARQETDAAAFDLVRRLLVAKYGDLVAMFWPAQNQWTGIYPFMNRSRKIT